MTLPDRASLEYLRKQAKTLKRAHGEGEAGARSRVASVFADDNTLTLARAQLVVALEQGYQSWTRLKLAVDLQSMGFEEKARAYLEACVTDPNRAAQIAQDTPDVASASLLAKLLACDADELQRELDREPGLVSRPIKGMGGPDRPPLVWVATSAMWAVGAPQLECARLLLDRGADPNVYPLDQWGGGLSALYMAVEHRNVSLARLLLEAGADTNDGNSAYHACEIGSREMLELLFDHGHRPDGIILAHRLDFEDPAGVAWLIERGVQPDADLLCHAVRRGRSTTVLDCLLNTGADGSEPSTRDGRSALQLAAARGDVAAYDLLRSRGATGEIDTQGQFMLAVARGDADTAVARELLQHTSDTGDLGEGGPRLLAHMAVLNNVDALRALLDLGMDVDTPGWSDFPPIHLAAQNGRADAVAFLLERGADLNRSAFGDSAALGFAFFGLSGMRHPDGDYPRTIDLLLAAGADVPGELEPTGDEAVDTVLRRHGVLR